VARCFGIYRGRDVIRADPERDITKALAHVPTGRQLAMLDRVGACKRLAEAVAPLRMNWNAIDPDRVAGADAGKGHRPGEGVRAGGQSDPARLYGWCKGPAAMKTASFHGRAVIRASRARAP
jgi:hypothetical protein